MGRDVMTQTSEVSKTEVQAASGGAGAVGASGGEPQSPFCGELRSKKYYFMQETPTEDHHILDVTNHCWCRQTMQAIGPDGERAHARDCKTDRACFRSL